MSQRDPALVQEFANEVSEHIEASEQILVRPGTEPPTADEINLLFRSFHSVKGLSRVVNFAALESLAHESESLLATFRSGSQSFNDDAQDLLLKALDAIKQARADLLAGKEFEANPQLIDGLKAALKGGGSLATTAKTSSDDTKHPNADLFFDSDTLVAQGELFEELLPDLARAFADPSSCSPERVHEDVELIQFALSRIHLPALTQALSEAASRKTAFAFAKFLRVLENFRHLIGTSCGWAEAALAVRSWFRRELEELLQRGELLRGMDLLAVLTPGSPMCALLPAIANLPDSDPSKSHLLQVAHDAIHSDLQTDAAQISPLSALAAEQIRERLLASILVPEAGKKWWTARKLDPDRFQIAPPSLLERLPVWIKSRSGELYEAIVPQPAEGTALAELSNAISGVCEILLTERTVIDGGASLAFLIFSSKREDEFRTLLTLKLPHADGLVLRKLDGRQNAAHFGIKLKPSTATAMGGAQVRVPVELLDMMFGRIGQFFSVSSRFNAMVYDSQAHEILRELSDYMGRHAPQLLPKIDWLVRQQNDFASLEAEAHRLISLIHETTLGLRVIPIDTLFNRFPRMVRDTAQKQKKLVRFEAHSKGIRVDNGMVELLADPLMHMLRNSVDHGIEGPEDRLAAGKPRTASLVLSAEQRGNHIVVEIADDGRGINIERVRGKAVAAGLVSEEQSKTLSDEQIARFIFTPGFSTAEKITDTSGRGVGMDVALVNVTKLGGKIEIQTRAGRGTTFRLDMPLSKAIQPMLLAETGIQTVAFPDRIVVEGTLVPSSELQLVNGQRSILLHDRFLPVFRLVDLLQLPSPVGMAHELMSIIVCEYGERRIGIEVHKILRRNDLLIQEMHPRIAHLPGIGGISTLGTDRIVIVVDPDGLFELAKRSVVTGLRNHPTHNLETLSAP